jgi:TM2 domain-containing membrane protein YozV
MYQGQSPYQANWVNGINPAWPIKSKAVAGILAIFFGGIGIHKFYLGKVGLGVIYLLFSWTFIPAFIGLIEGIVYLASNEHNFQVSNQVRIR